MALGQDSGNFDPRPGLAPYNPLDIDPSWSRATPYLLEKRLSDPSQGSSTYLTWSTTAPSVLEFELRRRDHGDYLCGPTWLNFRLNQGAASTAYGAEFYGVNHLGAQAIDKVEYLYNGRPLFRIYGHEIVEWYCTMRDGEETAAAMGCGGGFSDDKDSIQLRKQFLQQADNYLKVRIPSPWESYRGGVWLYALASSIVVRVTFHPVTRFIAHTSTTTPGAVYLDRFKLYTEGIHYLEQFRQAQYQALFGGKAHTHKFFATDVEHPTSLPLSTTSFSSTVSVPLRQMANSCFLFKIYAFYLGFNTPQANSNGSNTQFSDLAPTEYLPIERVQLVDGNTAISNVSYWRPKSAFTRAYTHTEQSDQLIDLPRIHPNMDTGRKLALIPMCHPKLVESSYYDGAFGTRVLRRYNAPQLDLKFPDESATGTASDSALYRFPTGTGTHTNLQVRVVGFFHQFITQTAGDLKVLFTQM
jgi:hypothetical protein